MRLNVLNIKSSMYRSDEIDAVDGDTDRITRNIPYGMMVLSYFNSLGFSGNLLCDR